MPARPGELSRERSGWLYVVERLLLMAGAAMLAWSACLVIDMALTQSLGRMSLRVAVPPPPAGQIASTTTETPEDADAPLALLSVPRIGLSAVVLRGTDAPTLRRGPGHMSHTALPGQPGNAVIAGHRDTFFSALRDIAVGDDIYIDTARGSVHYRVTSTAVVHPRDLSVIADTPQTTLTLITCYPFWVFGPAPDRFIVRATRVGEPPSLLPSVTSTGT